MDSGSPASQPQVGRLTVGTARLFYRHVGEGHPMVVVHGGPDFDHTYLLPELDRLADSFRVVYYDQRGRGRSADGVQAIDVTVDTEVADLDALADHLELDRIAILGHSWGGIIAMEYAVRHPDRVSQLVLMNSAPVSHTDRTAFSAHLACLRSPEDVEEMTRLRNTDAFQQGDIETEAAYYRIHFKADGSAPEQTDAIVGRLRTHFTPQTVLLARAIEHRLHEQTWLRDHYDLLTALAAHPVPTLVIHGDRDFVPVEIAHHVAEMITDAQLAVLADCGHFAFIDHPDRVHDLIQSR